ncbi:MAG: hypothetical protein Q9M48_14375 [Rhodobacterales bacterium]|nr:hypothetical protein [Rhodobacterales bacterium]
MSKLHLGPIGALVVFLAANVAPSVATARVFATLFPVEEQSTPLGASWVKYLPPVGYVGENWTHPNGCAYARNGRRDREIWVLKRGVDYLNCASIIAQAGHLEAY